MKLWLDDIRFPPEGWEWAKSAARAIEILSNEDVEEISLDHDLGQDGATQTPGGMFIPASDQSAGCGYDVAVWIEEAAHAGTLPPIIWSVHSANPVGAERMKQAMESADRAWSKGLWNQGG